MHPKREPGLKPPSNVTVRGRATRQVPFTDEALSLEYLRILLEHGPTDPKLAKIKEIRAHLAQGLLQVRPEESSG